MRPVDDRGGTDKRRKGNEMATGQKQAAADAIRVASVIMSPKLVTSYKGHGPNKGRAVPDFGPRTPSSCQKHLMTGVGELAVRLAC